MKLIIANWKMYPKTLSEGKVIFSGMKKNALKYARAKVIVCPPHLFVAPLIGLRGTGKVAIGAQNASSNDEGAETGETSPFALAALGATHVILGHSERRAMGEESKDIAAKAAAAARNKLTTVLCVGEKVRDEGGAYFTEVKEQLRASLHGFPKTEAKRLVIAYEPIWAIGVKAKKAAEPGDFHEMSILIKRQLVEYFGKKTAFAVPILYGGSVDDKNAERFLSEGHADGFLVGRASLDTEKFGTIMRIAHLSK